MTFIYELDLIILKTYLHTNNELSYVEAFKSYSITDRRTRPKILPYMCSK